MLIHGNQVDRDHKKLHYEISVRDPRRDCAFVTILGASACVKLNLFEEAMTWCDEGLAVSFAYCISFY